MERFIEKLTADRRLSQRHILKACQAANRRTGIHLARLIPEESQRLQEFLLSMVPMPVH